MSMFVCESFLSKRYDYILKRCDSRKVIWSVFHQSSFKWRKNWKWFVSARSNSCCRQWKKSCFHLGEGPSGFWETHKATTFYGALLCSRLWASLFTYVTLSNYPNNQHTLSLQERYTPSQTVTVFFCEYGIRKEKSWLCIMGV